MKYLLTITILLFFSLAKGQAPTVPVITYTPMGAAGYQFKYLKADSGFNVPNRDTSYGRGTRRGGSIVFDSTNRIFYGWDGIKWTAFGTGGGGGTFIGIDSITYNNNFICQWKSGASTCYPVIPGVDSVTVTGDTLLCQWKAGVSTCYTINGNVLGVFVDSVVVAGTQLCQWIAGTSTCYTINSVNTSIDSITIVNNNFCIYINGVASCITLNPDTVYVKDDLYVVWDSTGHQVIGRLHDDGLVSGGYVTKSDCWTVDVTPPTYYFNNTRFVIGKTLGLVIDSADVLPRIDYVVADSFGLIYVIPGTPGVTPQDPVINVGYQVLLPGGRIYIPGGASCLGIGIETIYDENTGAPEWTPTTSGTISADPDDTNNPYHLTKADFVSTYTDGSQRIFTKSGAPDTLSNGAVLKAFPYFNSLMANQIKGQWFNGSTSVSNQILLNPYFDALDTGRYQVMVVPLNNWNFTSRTAVFNKLVFTFGGTDTSGADGIYMDWIQLQTGLDIFTPGKGVLDFTKNAAGDSIILTREDGIRFAVKDSSGGGATGVTDVTGTAPIISSGGTTPAISADTSKSIGRLATFSDNALKLNITDTTNKWVYNVTKNATFDSIVIWKGSTRTAIRDSASFAWNILGNNGLSAATNYIGTNDNVPMKFRQNNVFKMQLDTNNRSDLFIGNVPGIVYNGKANLLIWDTVRSRNSGTGSGVGAPFYFGMGVVKQVYKLIGDTVAGTVSGAFFEPRIGPQNTGDWAGTVYGLVGFRASNNIQTGATGTLARGSSIDVVADYAGMTITNRYGVWIGNPTMSGTAAITKNYGLYIKAQTAATLSANNYGFYSEAYNNQIALTAQLPNSTPPSQALYVTATNASVPTGTSTGVYFGITGAGSAGTANYNLFLDYFAGYTGSGSNAGLRVANINAGTGTNIVASLHNAGVFATNSGTTTGTNQGVAAWASNGNINIGLKGEAIVAKNSAKNIGLYVVAHNTAITAPIEIGAYISLDSSDIATATATSSVLVLNNSSQTKQPITIYKVNNVEKARVDSAGRFLLNTTTSDASSALQMNGNINLNTAGNKLKITTGSNASLGVSGAMTAGTITISTTAVTSSSKIFLTAATVGGTVGVLSVGTIVDATSFVINSSSGTDTSTVNWWIIN